MIRLIRRIRPGNRKNKMLTINITEPAMPEELRRIPELLAHPKPLLAAGGQQLASDLRDHFGERDKQPNKMGWPSKHFWAGIRGATALASVSDDSATVSISDPAINQKVYGGTITPKRGRMLAIPMNADAYRAGSPRSLQTDFLHIIATRKGVFLVEREATKIARRRGKKGGYKPVGQMGLRFWYHLVPSVTQDPDPNALPDENYLYGSVLYAIRGVLDAEIERGA